MATLASRIPFGTPRQLEVLHAMESFIRKQIDAHRFVEIVSTNPARMFGLWPRKGTIAVGSDGDLVVWDPEKETVLSAKTHHMKVDYNPYEGRKVTGGAAKVLSRGEVIVDGGKFVGKKGRGKFVKRDPGAPLVA